MSTAPCIERTARLFGTGATDRLARTRVIIFGVGGVGSWCAEALVRSGIAHLTIVDADVVDVTNINRQLPATTLTVGLPKAEVLRQRLLEINPGADIAAMQTFYTAENAAGFDLGDYDVVVDAIDSVASKAALLLQATSLPGIKVYSSMGAARRIDPGQISTAEFWKVKGCPLARALRDRYKKAAVRPRRKVMCVYSPEPPKGEEKGTSVAVTASFGLRLAALIVNGVAAAADNESK